MTLMCGSGGMADTSDLKSDALSGVRVRVPPAALKEIPHNTDRTLTAEFQPLAACEILDYP